MIVPILYYIYHCYYTRIYRLYFMFTYNAVEEYDQNIQQLLLTKFIIYAKIMIGNIHEIMDAIF